MFEKEEIVLAILNSPEVYDTIETYFKKYKVVGIMTNSIDEFKENHHQCEVPLYDYDIMNKTDKKIIVADTLWHNSIRHSFYGIINSGNLKLGENFIFESLQGGKIDTNLIFQLVNKDLAQFNKLLKIIVNGRKIVLVHGNCQVHVISSMLSGNKEFVKGYITCVMPQIWEGEEEKIRMELMMESGIFAFADYLFTQEVSADNKFWYKFSTEFLRTLVGKSCNVITISNLFFLGYFPQYRKMQHSAGVNFFRGKILDATEYMDINVLRMIVEDKSDEEILEAITDTDYYEKDKILSLIDDELEEFKIREENIDIKMHDYLVDNCKKYLTFATSNHPTREVLKELTRRILRELRIDELEINCSDDEIQEPMPSDWRYLVYPSVLKQLGIKRKLGYYFKAILSEEELKIIPGGGYEGAEVQVSEHGNMYLVNIKGSFEIYMQIYIRCVRAALMLL